MRVAWLAIGIGVAALLAAASPAFAYDQSWYRAEFWGGEYPHGFTLSEDVTTPIRAEPDPAAAPSIDCALKKGETYHPWNAERVAASGLAFVTYSLKVPYEIVTPIETDIYPQSEGDAETHAFKAGEQWTYLTYLAEGSFLMAFSGKTYSAEQELIDASKEAGDIAIGDTPDDEWMQLTCANGATGWLLLSDVVNEPAFGGPNITEYGKAEDLAP